MKIEGVETEFLCCECHSNEHTVKYTLFDSMGGREYPELSVSIYLNQWRGFWKRLWTAVKYVFKVKPKHGHWDTWNIDGIEDAQKLIKLLHKYIEEVKFYEYSLNYKCGAPTLKFNDKNPDPLAMQLSKKIAELNAKLTTQLSPEDRRLIELEIAELIPGVAVRMGIGARENKE